MARQWEKFTAGPTILNRDRMHVTLNGKGVITMNRRAYQEFGAPKSVVLFFEKSTGVIGVSPSHHSLREAFPVNIRNGTYWTINAIPFCRHFGIKLDHTESFTEPEIDDKGILLLDLRKTKMIFGGFRRKNKLRREAALAAARKAA